MVILLTDGSQSYEPGTEDPKLIAKELAKIGIQIIVIGIGKEVQKPELLSIAGQSDRVYNVDNFDELISKEFVGKVSVGTCECSKYISQN